MEQPPDASAPPRKKKKKMPSAVRKFLDLEAKRGRDESSSASSELEFDERGDPIVSEKKKPKAPKKKREVVKLSSDESNSGDSRDDQDISSLIADESQEESTNAKPPSPSFYRALENNNSDIASPEESSNTRSNEEEPKGTVPPLAEAILDLEILPEAPTLPVTADAPQAAPVPALPPVHALADNEIGDIIDAPIRVLPPVSNVRVQGAPDGGGGLAQAPEANQAQAPAAAAPAEEDPDAAPLAFHNHYHVLLIVSRAIADEYRTLASADDPLLHSGAQEDFYEHHVKLLMMMQGFGDVKVSKTPKKQGRWWFAGGLRYVLLSSDCSQVAAFLTAVNMQMMRGQFRQAHMRVFEEKLAFIPGALSMIENLMYALRTVTGSPGLPKGARKGIPSLSNRYDRAQWTPIDNLPLIPKPIQDRISFDLRITDYLVKNQYRIKQNIRGEWTFHKRIEGMYFAYKEAFGSLEDFKAHLMALGGRWEVQLKTYAIGNWNTEFGVFAKARLPKLQRDWHWCEFKSSAKRHFSNTGGGWLYIADDPHVKSDNTAKRYEDAQKYSSQESLSLQGDWYWGMPAWWPLPGSIAVQEEDSKGKPLPSKFKKLTRRRVNMFLHESMVIGVPGADGAVTRMKAAEFVKAHLVGHAVGFSDEREGMLCEFDSIFESMDERESDDQIRRPVDWYRIVEPYRYPCCLDHDMRPHRDDPTLKRCYRTTGTQNCYYYDHPLPHNHADPEPYRGLGVEDWERRLLDRFRGAIEPTFMFRKPCLLVWGESNFGKSSMFAAFTDNKGGMFPSDAHFICGDGSKADVMAGLKAGVEVRIAVFTDFDPMESFPKVGILKRFTEGGKQGARGMRQNTSRADADFYKMYECNPHYEWKKDEDTGARVKVPCKGHTPYDNGNPLGPHYDALRTFDNRLENIHLQLPVRSGYRDLDLRYNILANSIDLLVELATLRYIPQARRNKWSLGRNFKIVNLKDL